jgi:hypothetical protein
MAGAAGWQLEHEVEQGGCFGEAALLKGLVRLTVKHSTVLRLTASP